MADPEEKEQTKPAEGGAEQQSKPKGFRATVTREGACLCTISVEAEAEHLQQRYNEQLATFQKETQFAGFRKGKAPVDLLERKFGSKIRSEVLSSVASEAYEDAVKENNLSVVTELESPDPDKMDWQLGQPAKFEFKCELLPTIELSGKQYKGLEVEVPKIEVTEDAFEREMKRFATQLATWEEVKGASIDWDDYVEAEVSLADEAGAPWRDTVAFYPREERIGPFSVEGIKGAITGLKAGSTMEIAGRLPEEEAELKDAPQALKDRLGTYVKLRVAIKAVYRQRVPEIDDELAKKLNLKSAEDIRSIVRERLQRGLQQQKDDATRYSLVNALLTKMDFEMPSTLVESAAAEERRKLLIRALRAGKSRQEAEEILSENADRSREVALRNLKASFLLRRIADEERIYVLDIEVQDQVRAMAARMGWSEHRAERYMEENDLMQSLRWDMREDRTVQHLLKSAKVNEVTAEEFAAHLREATRGAEQTAKSGD